MGRILGAALGSIRLEVWSLGTTLDSPEPEVYHDQGQVALEARRSARCDYETTEVQDRANDLTPTYLI